MRIIKKAVVLVLVIVGIVAVSAVYIGQPDSREEETAEITASPTPTDTPTPTPTPTATPTPTPEPVLVLDSIETVEAGTILTDEEIDFDDLGKYFVGYDISDEVFSRIYGDDRSYKTYCTVPREDLKYLKLLHYGFDGEIHVGELMVNTLLADEVCEIFRILFENQYQIEKMYLIDNYNADDLASIADNNTSAFNYRLVTGGDYLSNHAGGCAIDINPINNPYVWYENGALTWEDPDADLYLDRNAEDAYERHMINHNDICYTLFIERGWDWGGNWENPIDYQHFEKPVAYY